MVICKNHPAIKLLYRKTGHLKLEGFYRVYCGKRDGQEIWAIDGERVCERIYPPFLMGGNDQRYLYNPPNEAWLDNRSGIEEFRYTLAHELLERRLMLERGWTYGRAHREAIKLEKRMRDADLMVAIKHEKKVKQGSGHLPRGIYRQFFGTRKGLKVWIVDGPLVRRELWGDFSMSGHGLLYQFVPDDEIWLDSAMTLEQVCFTLVHVLAEREAMAKGLSYAEAYEYALCAVHDERKRQAQLVARHEAKLKPVRYGSRDRGVKRQS
jgi:hypothetical protein